MIFLSRIYVLVRQMENMLGEMKLISHSLSVLDFLEKNIFILLFYKKIFLLFYHKEYLCFIIL